MWDVGCSVALQGPGERIFLVFFAACGILVKFLTPPPTPGMCHGQIMTSGAKHLNTGGCGWEAACLP